MKLSELDKSKLGRRANSTSFFEVFKKEVDIEKFKAMEEDGKEVIKILAERWG